MRIFQLKVSPLKASSHVFGHNNYFITTHNLIPEKSTKKYAPSILDMSIEDLEKLCNNKRRK